MELGGTNTFVKTYAVYCLGKYRQIVSMGGSRSSKTWSILQILLIVLLQPKRRKITVWRDTKVVCRATVMEDFKQILMANYSLYKKFKENKQRGSFTYKPTGSEILFEGSDSVGKVLGGAQDISYFNEITEFSKAVYLQITQRTAETIFSDYNPSKDFWLNKYKQDPESIFIHSTFLDNGYCPPQIVKQLLSYEPWESGSYQIVKGDAYYQGKPISQSNYPPPNKLNVKRGTANEYMWLVYGLGIGAEKPSRVYHGWHKIPPSIFDSLEYTSYFGMDFGTSNPTAILEGKYDGDRAFYFYPRFYTPLANIDKTISNTLINEVPSMKPGESLVICDPAKQDYVDTMAKIGYQADEAIKGPGSVGSGITKVKGFTIYFVYDEQDPVTVSFYNEYINYSFEMDRYEKPTDKPVKKDDHFMDDVRYIITYLIEYLNIEI